MTISYFGRDFIWILWTLSCLKSSAFWHRKCSHRSITHPQSGTRVLWRNLIYLLTSACRTLLNRFRSDTVVRCALPPRLTELFPKGCTILISPNGCICCHKCVRCSKLHVFIDLEVGLASATALLGASDMKALVVASQKIIILHAAPSFLSFSCENMRRMTRKQDAPSFLSFSCENMRRQQQPQQECKEQRRDQHRDAYFTTTRISGAQVRKTGAKRTNQVVQNKFRKAPDRD